MRYLIIIFILAATQVQAQDTTHSAYVNDTSQYSRAMTAEELDEYFGEYNQETKTRGTKPVITNSYSPSVKSYMNQNPQDYTNFYYRKKRRSLLQIIFGG